ncbi:hypothetical protein [Halioxenophilus sp. WMMB6]|uniref:hypothetical protein n=1 Tax=Halioxenophilus sp. WMMB6 TaxID=3073815 RepID=UPI00295E7A5D|nr:hypothetical protein [Halioxenophilus sp. WMMB6]
MKGFLFWAAGLALAFWQSDLRAPDAWHGVYAPLAVMVFAIGLVVWLGLRFGGQGRRRDGSDYSSGDYSSGDYGGGGYDSGDCGSGDGGD